MIRQTKRETVILVAATIACSVFVLLVGYGMLKFRSRIVTGQCGNLEELARIPEFSLALPFLPKSGKDATYFAMPYATYFEVSFLCSEEAFLKWAVSQGWSDAEIQATSRGAIFSENYRAPAGATAGLIELPDAYFLRTKSVREDGPPIEARLMIYDPQRGRAYLQLHRHTYLAGDHVNEVERVKQKRIDLPR